MAFTLSQTRRAVLVDSNINQFSIESLVTDKGTLPYTEVFVYQIVTEDDAKDDIFLRVATIPDYTTIARSRDEALASDTSLLFLSASSIIYYDTLDVAIEGQKAIKDRVNTLVTTWLSYESDFEAYPTPETITLPTGTDSDFDAAVTAYKTAKQDRVDKEEVLSIAEDVLTATEQIQNIYAGVYSQMATFVTGGAERNIEMAAAQSGLGSLLTSSSIFLAAASCAADPAESSFSAAISLATTANAQALVDVADHNNFANSLVAYRDIIFTQKTAFDAQIISATNSVNIAQTNLTNAQTVEASRLADVIAICPDFDSASVECEC